MSRGTTGTHAPDASSRSRAAACTSRANPARRTRVPIVVGDGEVTKRKVPRRNAVERNASRLRISLPESPSELPSDAIATSEATLSDAETCDRTSVTAARIPRAFASCLPVYDFVFQRW